MTTTVADIIKILEEIAPVSLAESWDNPGLQVGRRDWPVKKVMIALDATRDVMSHASEKGADMLVTHHPLLFRPLKSIDLSTPIGEIIGNAIRNAISVYSLHTNFDSAEDGLNDELAARLGLKNNTVLAVMETSSSMPKAETGLGRIGDLQERTDLASLCRTIKKNLGLDSIRMIGDPHQTVCRVAICTGSGGDLLGHFYESDATVFITGDIRYHDARDAEERGRALIDIGHFGSEHIMVRQLGNRLSKIFGNTHPDVDVLTCEIEKDPFVVL